MSFITGTTCMLAGIPEFREIDFSHLKIELAGVESVAPVRNQQSTLLWLALFLSSLLHLSLLLVEFSSGSLRSKQVPIQQTLHIDLLQTPVKKRDTEPELMASETIKTQPDSAAVKDIVAVPVPEPVITTKKSRATSNLTSTPISNPTPNPTGLVIEPLSAQELAEIVEDHKAQAADQNPAAIAKNVFHPGLRAQLNAEANKPKLARVEDAGPKTYIDPAGATVVALDNGSCLMSPRTTKIGAPQNWYMTRCAGKSESEKIMERVEQSINGKLKFDSND